MKNFFRLEVFKDSQPIFDKLTPTTLITQVIAQWSAPEQGYSFKITFDSGLQVSSDELFSHNLTRSSLNDMSLNLEQEISLMSL
jgi:hypothetical protein